MTTAHRFAAPESIGTTEHPIRIHRRSETRPAQADPSDSTLVTTSRVRCSNCAMRNICMPEGLDANAYAKLDAVICTSRRVRRGEALYRSGEAFHNLYAVRLGSFKTVVAHPDGREQVTRFDLAGEALGLDGVYTDEHTCDAIALEDSVVCIIPFHLLELLCREVRLLQRHVHKMMSGEIVRESGQMMLLGNMRADERVAAFLLNISHRMKQRGYSASEFQLRMSREELGSYLGMKLETVSRTLSRFKRDALIAATGRRVRLLDIPRLEAI
ncbi:helix-turn-helix domain-containing protein [Robbsia andropogonis]|uniref:helix-turn-helix domain-containing protein n=1 Tax=Robbsia andropogonis TaxID=28092 RepID=UPI000465E1F2|nr:helix-turn-helix domain-containing protein [Robbsia andropogonis]MCP1118981.1 helix-turn-helix domain-containing protein [Robbsia andropogonis]MCP1128667.1 helix-turn-helix domain-containing protein [Robbsia andropogonis]